MKRKYFNWMFAAALGGVFLTTSCSDDNSDPAPNPPVASQTAYAVLAGVGEASYILTTNSLDEGTVSAAGNGTEVVSGVYFVVKDNDYAFVLQYNQGSAGKGNSYYLDANGSVRERYEYTLNRFTTYGLWGDDLITCSAGESKTTDSDGNIARALLFNYLKGTDGSQSESTASAENYLGNGEYVQLAGIVEANGKLYTSVVPGGMSKYGIKAWPDKVTDQSLIAATSGGSASSAYEAGVIPSTQYPDKAFVAIYSGEDFNSAPTILETDKIGFACGRLRSQYYQTIWAADNGDIYVFSPGYGRTFTSSADLKKVTGTLPSGVVRIKAGATEFDPDYYYNLEEIGTKKPIFRCWHMSEDYFLLQLYTDGVEGMMQGRNAKVNELAVFKGSDGSIKSVTGLPADCTFGGEPFNDNGYSYIGVSVTTGDKPALYKIDPQTGVATKGLIIDADNIRGAGKLQYTEAN